jgi:predicted DNA-binding protein (UPF0251 family)
VSRPCKCRFITADPPVSIFKPAGVPGRQLEALELGLDELEALRLADLEGLYHDAAAERMGVSRPTFGRLIERARHKVACALLTGKMLVFEGGPVMRSEQRTFECADCDARFQKPHGTGRPGECPQCHGKNFHRSVDERGRGRGSGQPAPAGGAESPGPGRCVRRRRGWAKLAVLTQGDTPSAECSQ